MRALGVICARAGSKTLPGKNVIPFNGTPLVVRTIRAALRSIHLDEVVVSTDCPYVKQLALPLTEVLDRPKMWAMDHSPIHEAVMHALVEMEQRFDKGTENLVKYDAVVCLQNSSPLRITEDIDRALEMLEKDPTADTVMSVVRADHYHPNLALVGIEDGGVIRHQKNDPKVFRRQEQEPVYFMSGIVYAMRRDSFVEDPFVPCGNMRGLVVPGHRSIDIHTWRDWRIAEEVAKHG